MAGNSTLILTGMLAGLNTDLRKELDGRNIRTGTRQVTSQKEVGAPEVVRTLLENAPRRSLSRIPPTSRRTG